MIQLASRVSGAIPRNLELLDCVNCLVASKDLYTYTSSERCLSRRSRSTGIDACIYKVIAWSVSSERCIEGRAPCKYGVTPEGNLPLDACAIDNSSET